MDVWELKESSLMVNGPDLPFLGSSGVLPFDPKKKF